MVALVIKFEFEKFLSIEDNWNGPNEGFAYSFQAVMFFCLVICLLEPLLAISTKLWAFPTPMKDIALLENDVMLIYIDWPGRLIELSYVGDAEVLYDIVHYDSKRESEIYRFKSLALNDMRITLKHVAERCVKWENANSAH